MGFYSNFISLCNSNGETPSHVVLEIGMKKSAVTRWKAGGKPTDASARKIADYFGVSVPELMGDDEQKTTTWFGDGPRNDVIQEIIDIALSLDSEGQKDMLEMAKIYKRRNK